MVTPAVEREAVAHLQIAFGMSERRACKILGCCRMTMRYQTRRTDDVVLRERMKAIAHERRRFGYRRLHVLLRRAAPVRMAWRYDPQSGSVRSGHHPSAHPCSSSAVPAKAMRSSTFASNVEGVDART